MIFRREPSHSRVEVSFASGVRGFIPSLPLNIRSCPVSAHASSLCLQLLMVVELSMCLWALLRVSYGPPSTRPKIQLKQLQDVEFPSRSDTVFTLSPSASIDAADVELPMFLWSNPEPDVVLPRFPIFSHYITLDHDVLPMLDLNLQ